MKIYLKNFNSRKELNNKLNSYEDSYFMYKGKPFDINQNYNENDFIEVKFRLKGGNPIYSDSQLKTSLENTNQLNLADQTFNFNISKIIKKEERFEILGNNSVINGNITIKSMDDVYLSNLKINGTINILAKNVYLNNIENNFLTNISSATTTLDNSKYIFNDLFIDGNIILKNNSIIKTNGFHHYKEVIADNYKLKLEKNDKQLIQYNSEIKINDTSNNLQKCLDICKITECWNYCNLNLENDIKVAILDTGIDSNHPELINNFLKDDQGNIIGKRFFDNQSDDNFDDDNGHGTHVAGIVGAETNNNLGIAGISFNNKIKLIPVKCINKFEDGYYSKNIDIANGIKWAVDQGADIINLSLGGFPGNDMIKNNIRYATNKGCLIVASAGNSTHPQKRGFVEYPAALPQVLSVGCVDEENNLTSFSSYKTDDDYPEKPEGHKGVDIVAPGLKIYSTFDHSDQGTYNNGYSYLSGTSMATPIITGVAALLMQQHSHYYRNPNIIRKVIFESAKCLNTSGSGYGLIDAKAAITYPFQFSKLKYRELITVTNRSTNNISNLENNIPNLRNNNSKKKSTNNVDKVLKSIQNNSIYYGAGLATMLGFFYFSNTRRKNKSDLDFDNLTDDDIDSMSKEELIILEKYLMEKYKN